MVQTAIKLVLEPIFEADFHNCSYGVSPTAKCEDGLQGHPKDLYQRAWGVVEIDFRSYFTTIAHAEIDCPDQTTRGGWEHVAADQAEPYRRGRLSGKSGADNGGSPARITDFAALQQHLPELAGPGVAQAGLPG